jgi:maleylpyruvate isomerase
MAESLPVIRLYRAPWSTNVERVALALAHKGLEVESVLISYDDRSPVVEVSGQPLVPVIVDEDGTVVADSTRILRHIEQRHPHPPLFPSDPARRAELDLFLEWFNEVWKGPPNAIDEELAKPEPDRERIEGQAERMRAWRDLFESLLDGRDHLLGDELTAADLAAFPFLKFAAGRDPEDREPFHLILEEHQRTDAHPRLLAWIERMDALPRAY